MLRTAWTAFEDVSPRNGTVWAQAGSHKGRLLTKHDFEEGAEFDKVDYNDGVDTIFAENEAAGMEEVPVVAKKGDVLYFHGCLIHRGGKIEEPGSSRHVFANHYVPSTFDGEQPDRRGAGTAAQCPPPARSFGSVALHQLTRGFLCSPVDNNWERGGIGRFSLAEQHAALERPTSLSFGVLPDGSGRAFLRQDSLEAVGNARPAINGADKEAAQRREKNAQAERSAVIQNAEPKRRS